MFYDIDEIICGCIPSTQIMVVIREALKQGVGTPKAKSDAFSAASALAVITVYGVSIPVHSVVTSPNNINRQ